MTAIIMPMTTPGGPPGGNPKTKTKITKPRPAIVPSAIPPRRAPTRMQASSIKSSIQSMTPGLSWRCERSVGVEQLLDLLCVSRLQQRQRQQNARLLWIQFIGCYEAELVVIHFHISSHRSRSDARTANQDHAFLCRSRGRFQRRLVHVAVTNAGYDDSLRPVCR